jgi:mannosyltransferase OCH1-like enzyme
MIKHRRRAPRSRYSRPHNPYIPYILYQTWKSHGGIRPEMRRAMRSFTKFNSRISAFLYDDKEARQWIYKQELKQKLPPNTLRAYSSLRPGAYKADLWRYCVLYVNGGYYADAKMRLLRPLRTFIRKNDRLVVVRDHLRGDIYNAFMAARPGHPVLRKAIAISIRNILARKYGRGALDITGPSVLGQAYNIWRGKPQRSRIIARTYRTHRVLTVKRRNNKSYIVVPAGRGGRQRRRSRVVILNHYKSYYQKDNPTSSQTNYRRLYKLRQVFL